MLQSLWNPFRDWNPEQDLIIPSRPKCFKASETLLGIETKPNIYSAANTNSFKASETLLGIET